MKRFAANDKRPTNGWKSSQELEFCFLIIRLIFTITF